MIHLSIDDFLFTFKDLTENEAQYVSLFDQPVFGFFRKLHEAYGVAFAGYCFGEDVQSGFSLADVSRKYRQEFTQNAHWLKFGFHGMNYDAVYGDNGGTRIINRSVRQAKEDYDYVIGHLAEIVGEDGIDRVPRIHFFAGSAECCKVWKEACCGITGLLSADDERYSYYHDDDMHDALLKEDEVYDNELGLVFLKTHIRLEKMNDLESLQHELEKFHGKCQVIFTHEQYLDDPVMLEKIEICAKIGME